MITIKVRVPKKTGVWTRYHGAHRAAEHVTRHEAVAASLNILRDQARHEPGRLTVHELDGQKTVTEIPFTPA
jgi:hypothetical protein